MKLINLVILLILFLNLTPTAQAAWWNTSWSAVSHNPIQDGVRPYVFYLNVTNMSGISNATHLYLNGTCSQVNCTDVRFTVNNVTDAPHRIETNATSTGFGLWWIRVPVNGTLNAYSGNPTVTPYNDTLFGANTAAFFEDGSSSFVVSAAAAKILDTSTYDAWNQLTRVNETHLLRTMRVGTAHESTDGKIQAYYYDIQNNIYSARTTIYDSVNDDRNTAGGMVGTKIFTFFAKYTGSPPYDGHGFSSGGYISSSDGGVIWSNYTAIVNYTLTPGLWAYSFYGNIVYNNLTNIHSIVLYGFDNSTGVHRTFMRMINSNDSGNTWTLGSYILNTTGTEYCEGALAYIGGGKYILVARETGTVTNVVTQFTSSDNGTTWSAPTATNMLSSAYDKAVSLIYDSDDNTVICACGTWGTNNMYYSITNATTVFNSPTSWITPKQFSTGGYLGNPVIAKIGTGKYLVVWGHEVGAYPSPDMDDYGYIINYNPNWMINSGIPTTINGELIIDNDAIQSWNKYGVNTRLRLKVKMSASQVRQRLGIGDTFGDTIMDVGTYNGMDLYFNIVDSTRYAETSTAPTGTQIATGGYDANYHVYDFIRNGTTSTLFKFDGVDLSGTPISTNIASQSGYITLIDYANSAGTATYDWLFMIPYIYPEPTFATWGAMVQQVQQVTISCPATGWCYVGSNHSSITLLALDNLFSTDTIQGYFDNSTKKYVSHRTGYAFNENRSVFQKQGYFYYFTSPQDITVTIPTSHSINLVTGWNMIGNMQSSPRTLAALKTSVGVTATQASYYNKTLRTWVAADSQSVPEMENFFVYVTSQTDWSD